KGICAQEVAQMGFWMGLGDGCDYAIGHNPNQKQKSPPGRRALVQTHGAPASDTLTRFTL
ncbi:hypothetical protein, partial [Halopseudomonas pelagia]|uniref:hypothetical protein n=1 Tax=Halopseudomonas pelagia TaxID=553151 RepID=UPI0030DC2B06